MQSTHPANAPASATEVSRLLGDVDPLVVERIIETGATIDEVTEALRDEIDDIGFDEPHPPSSPRVAEVRALIEELVLSEPDDDQPSV